ncbi:MAG: BRCT domain-containing protein [Myxococcales bacterium]|nr:BRCT domain-containing protein [Myxococcales bacterium]
MTSTTPPTWEVNLPDSFHAAWLHPDGRRLVLSINLPGSESALQIFDLERGTLSERVLLDGGFQRSIMLEHATLADAISLVRIYGDYMRERAQRVLVDLETGTVSYRAPQMLPGYLRTVTSAGDLIVASGPAEMLRFEAVLDRVESTPRSWRARARNREYDVDPTGRWLVAHFEGRYFIHDLWRAAVRRRRRYYSRSFSWIEVAPDGQRFYALGANGRELCVFSLPQGRLLRRWTLLVGVGEVRCEGAGETLLLLQQSLEGARAWRFDPERERGALVWSLPGLHTIHIFDGWLLRETWTAIQLYDLRRPTALDLELTAPRAAPLQGKVYALSGPFERVDKGRLRRDLRACGASVVGSLARGMTALLAGRGETATKRRARALGIPIVEEAGLSDALLLGLECDTPRRWAILEALLDRGPNVFTCEHVLAHLDLWPQDAREGVTARVNACMEAWPEPLRSEGLQRLEVWSQGGEARRPTDGRGR